MPDDQLTDKADLKAAYKAVLSDVAEAVLEFANDLESVAKIDEIGVDWATIPVFKIVDGQVVPMADTKEPGTRPLALRIRMGGYKPPSLKEE